MKKEDIFANTKDLKTMCGNDNKIRIQRLIRSEFMNAAQSKQRRRSKSFNSTNEAGTIIISICYTSRGMEEDCTILIDSGDTDVYVQAVFAAHNIDGNSWQNVNLLM